MCSHNSHVTADHVYVLPTLGLPREKWLKAFWAADLAACEKSCNDDAKCQSITFRKDWTKNCNHFETRCLYRQPQSMAIAKTVKLGTSTPSKNAAFCNSPNAACGCKAGYTINKDQTKCSGVCLFGTDPNPPPYTLFCCC